MFCLNSFQKKSCIVLLQINESLKIYKTNLTFTIQNANRCQTLVHIFFLNIHSLKARNVIEPFLKIQNLMTMTYSDLLGAFGSFVRFLFPALAPFPLALSDGL